MDEHETPNNRDLAPPRSETVGRNLTRIVAVCLLLGGLLTLIAKELLAMVVRGALQNTSVFELAFNDSKRQDFEAMATLVLTMSTASMLLLAVGGTLLLVSALNKRTP